jgi:hypothetical protein
MYKEANDTFAAISPRLDEMAKWFWMTRKEGSFSPLATAWFTLNQFLANTSKFNLFPPNLKFS